MTQEHHHMQHYADRRFKAFESMGDCAACLIPSSRKIIRNGDTEYAYRQNSYLYYLTGWEEDETVLLLLAKDGKRRTILFCQESNETEARWVGKRVGLENAKKQFGVDEAYLIDEMETTLPELLSNTKKVVYPLGENLKFDMQLRRCLKMIGKLKRVGWSAPKEHIELSALLDNMRCVKRGDEIARMRKAASISAAAHCRGMKTVHPGMHEYELEAEYRYEFTRHGAQEVAYQPIVASGPNACVLHYVKNQSQMKDGELVLVDAACEYQGYAADITRTYPVNGKFTKPQREIYELVLASQMAALEMARPNQPWHKMQTVILDVLVQGLVDLGLLEGNVKTLIEKGAYKPYYMHQSGHWLGLDVHDVGDYKINGEWRTLLPGMTLTIEPGLYFPSEDLTIPDAYRGIGVRIEDDILITDNAPEVLSAEVPKTVADIERLMSKK